MHQILIQHSHYCMQRKKIPHTRCLFETVEIHGNEWNVEDQWKEMLVDYIMLPLSFHVVARKCHTMSSVATSRTSSAAGRLCDLSHPWQVAGGHQQPSHKQFLLMPVHPSNPQPQPADQQFAHKVFDNIYQRSFDTSWKHDHWFICYLINYLCNNSFFERNAIGKPLHRIFYF
jgi:hypothetical protein